MKIWKLLFDVIQCDGHRNPLEYISTKKLSYFEHENWKEPQIRPRLSDKRNAANHSAERMYIFEHGTFVCIDKMNGSSHQACHSFHLIRNIWWLDRHMTCTLLFLPLFSHFSLPERAHREMSKRLKLLTSGCDSFSSNLFYCNSFSIVCREFR